MRQLASTGSSAALIRCQGAVGDHQVPGLTWRGLEDPHLRAVVRKWRRNLARLRSIAIVVASSTRLNKPHRLELKEGHMEPTSDQSYCRLLVLGRKALRLFAPALLAVTVLTVVGGVPAGAQVSATANSGSTWTTQIVPSGTNYLNAIACPSTTTCYAVGENKLEFRSHNPRHHQLGKHLDHPDGALGGLLPKGHRLPVDDHLLRRGRKQLGGRSHNPRHHQLGDHLDHPDGALGDLIAIWHSLYVDHHLLRRRHRLDNYGDLKFTITVTSSPVPTRGAPGALRRVLGPHRFRTFLASLARQPPPVTPWAKTARMTGASFSPPPTREAPGAPRRCPQGPDT